jgi:hypothetical protein
MGCARKGQSKKTGLLTEMPTARALRVQIFLLARDGRSNIHRGEGDHCLILHSLRHPPVSVRTEPYGPLVLNLGGCTKMKPLESLVVLLLSPGVHTARRSLSRSYV